MSGVTEFNAQWKALSQIRGLDKIARALERMFGEEIAKTVVEKQTRDIEASRARHELGMQKASGIVTGLASTAVQQIRPNTFYGEPE